MPRSVNSQNDFILTFHPNMDKRKNWTRGVKNFSAWGVKPKNFERGSHQNSTRRVGPFFAKKNFQVGESKFLK